MLQTVKNLPVAVGPLERFSKEGQKKRKIFTLDDYSAHLDPIIQEKLYNKGYILIVLDGGITGKV